MYIAPLYVQLQFHWVIESRGIKRATQTHTKRQFIIINVVLSEIFPSSVTLSLVKYINYHVLLSVLGNVFMFPFLP